MHDAERRSVDRLAVVASVTNAPQSRCNNQESDVVTTVSRRYAEEIQTPEFGWGLDGVTQVPIGDDASRIAALRTKSLDAAIVNLAVAINFVQRGDGRILLRFNDLLKDFHAHVIFATDKSIAARPEALRGFLKGWFETIAFMRANKPETVRIAKDIMGTDEITAGMIYDELMPMFSSIGKFEPKALAVLSRSFAAAGRSRGLAPRGTERGLSTGHVRP